MALTAFVSLRKTKDSFFNLTISDIILHKVMSAVNSPLTL